jgi:hypothetical protein
MAVTAGRAGNPTTEQHPTGAHSTHDEHDPDREPSADWGWHGEFPVVLGTILVMMLIASHWKAYKDRRRWRD